MYVRTPYANCHRRLVSLSWAPRLLEAINISKWAKTQFRAGNREPETSSAFGGSGYYLGKLKFSKEGL